MKPVFQGYTDKATLKRKPGLPKGFKYHAKKKKGNSFADVDSTLITPQKKCTINYTVES